MKLESSIGVNGALGACGTDGEYVGFELRDEFDFLVLGIGYLVTEELRGATMHARRAGLEKVSGWNGTS